MDDLLREFLTETNESLDTVDDPRMAKLAGGVHRLDGQLMVVLDVDRVLEIAPKTALAA
jgi:chemotaxis signal transduction protein